MEKTNNYHWSCLVCKELNEKDHKKGLAEKYLLSSMIWFNTEEEAINHLKNFHPKEFKLLTNQKSKMEGKR